MKHRLFTPATLLLLCLFLYSGMGWGQIAAWDFFGQSSPASFAATTFNSNLVSISGASNITRGSGASASTGSNSFRTQGFQNNGISTANTDYFQITISPATGYKVSLSTIDAKFAGTSSYYASPGVTSQFAYSLNGTSFTLIGSPVQTTSLTLTQISLAGVSALQDISAGTTIYLRYYASGQTTTGGWGFASSSSGVNGLAIGGSVTSTITTPTTQASAITFSDITTSGLTSSWTNGNGSSCAVFVREGGPGTITPPVDGTTYTADADWSSKGTQLGTSGYYCVYNGSGSTVILTNLADNTTYWVQIFEYNGSGATSKYFTDEATGNPNSQATDANTTPTITVGTLTAFGNQVINTTSPFKSYSVSGSNLTDDIAIAPPDGFQISESEEGDYTSDPIILTQSGGTVDPTTIYVKFAPTALSAYSDNITHTSDGVTTQNVAVSGTGISPANPATFTAMASSSTQINLAATANENTNDIVVVYDGDNTFTAPTDAVAAGDVGTSFAGGTILYKGAAASLPNHTSLSSGQTVYYKAFSVDALNFYSSGSSASATTAKSEPSNHASDFSVVVGPADPDIIELGWDDAASGVLPDAYLVKASTVSFAAISAPVDGTPESTGTLVKNVNQGVMDALFSGLDPNTTYYFRIFPYTNSGSLINYKTDGTIPEISSTTAPESSPGDYFRTAGSGYWTELSSWESSANGNSWYAATLYPTASSSGITIRNGHTITINSSMTIETLTITSTSTLSVTSGTLTIGNGEASTDLQVYGTIVNSATINVTGTAAFFSGSTYQHSKNGSGGTLTTSANTSWDSNSNFLVTGWTNSSTSPFNSTVNYGNIRWNSTSQSATLQCSGSLVNVGGTLRVSSTGSGSSVLRLNTGSHTINISQNLVVDGGALEISNGSNSGTFIFNIGGNFTVSSGIFNPNTGTSTTTINLTGSGKTFTFSGGTLTNDRINWNFPSGASFTLASNLPVASGRTLTLGGTLDCGTYTVTGSGGITTTSGAQIKIAHASGYNGCFSLSGTPNYHANTNIEFNGSSAQVTGTGLPSSFGNLTINNAAGVTLYGNRWINGALNLESGAFNISANTLHLVGDLNITGGTLVGGSTSSISIEGSGSSLTLPGITLGNLTLERSEGIVLGGQVTVNTMLTLTSGEITYDGGTLTMGNGATITRTGGAVAEGIVFAGAVNVIYNAHSMSFS